MERNCTMKIKAEKKESKQFNILKIFFVYIHNCNDINVQNIISAGTTVFVSMLKIPIKTLAIQIHIV